MLHAPMQIRRVAPTAVRPASDTDSFCPLPAADITKPHPAPGLNLGSTWAQPGHYPEAAPSVPTGTTPPGFRIGIGEQRAGTRTGAEQQIQGTAFKAPRLSPAGERDGG